MVRITKRGPKVLVEIEGWDKLWSFKSRLEIPLVNIKSVRADPEIARGLWKGLRAPGTHLPGVIIAGTYYRKGQRVFWDVKDAKKAIVIDLADNRYNQLVLEVGNPPQTVSQLRKWMSPPQPKA